MRLNLHYGSMHDWERMDSDETSIISNPLHYFCTMPLLPSCINHNIESDAVQEGKIYTIDKLHAHERVQEKLKEISL